MSCNSTDFMFPMCADVFYPDVTQGAYGNVKKMWMFDKSIACNFASPSSAMSEDVKPNPNITKEMMLVGRVKQDIRVNHRESANSITNVVVSNIKDAHGNEIYVETSGVRKGKSTIFEIAGQEPFVGPFGSIEYYKVTLRRSENQGVDV